MGKIFAVFICPSPETHHNVSATHCCLLLHYYVFNIKNRNHTTQLQFLSPSYLVWMSSQRVILRQYAWWYFPFSDEPRICVPIDHNDHHHVEINEEYRLERWMLMVIKGSRMTMPTLWATGVHLEQGTELPTSPTHPQQVWTPLQVLLFALSKGGWKQSNIRGTGWAKNLHWFAWRHINDPLSRKHYSLVSVSEPWVTFSADIATFKGPQPCHVHGFWNSRDTMTLSGAKRVSSGTN